MQTHSNHRNHRNHRPGYLRRSLAGAACFALLWSCGTLAAPQDTIVYSVGLAQRHDNNLFRLPAGVDPLSLVGQSARTDSITTTTFGIDFKKAWSLQQVEAGYQHAATRYATYGFLDHEANNARALWRWRLTPRLGGNLLASHDEALLGFGDYRNYGTRNLRTTETFRVDADWDPWRSGWRLRAGADRTESRNSQAFTQEEGSRLASVELGLGYVFPSTSRIDFIARAGRGHYQNRTPNPVIQLDNEFDERRQEARLYWAASGKSSVEGSIGRVSRWHENFPSRDYSDAIGHLKWTWMPTGKLSLALSWRSDLAVYTDLQSSYYRQESYSLMPAWQVSPKLRFNLRLERSERSYLGALVPLPNGARHEQVSSTRLDAEWAPLRALSVSAFISDERRTANRPGLAYDARVIGANLRFAF